MRAVLAAMFCVLWVGLVIGGCFVGSILPAQGRDDGRYAQSPLKGWFDQLKSKKGLCCSLADGRRTEYDIRDGSYWVPVDSVMTRVPDGAVITEPNKAGQAMLWLTFDKEIRCFIPGSGA